MLKKLVLRNYRVFREFQLEFFPELNLLVGDNGTGKSTLLEAISVALTGRLGRAQLSHELSPYLFNADAVHEYTEGLRSGANPVPPELLVELYLEDSEECALLKGTNNSLSEDVPGVRIRAVIDDDFAEEYCQYIQNAESIRLVPTEYYKIEWLSFAGNAITARSMPASASRIDASEIRLYNGADYYLQQIIRNHLDVRERVELARSYRSLRESFSGLASVSEINAKLADSSSQITSRALSLSIDVSQRTAWESSLVPHLDDLPLQYSGNGERNALKILLSLSRDVEESHIVLIEEPENHLSFSSMNALLGKIAYMCRGKQVIATTHSSYVLNKLGLGNLILLSATTGLRITQLRPDTQDYFKKLPGYDTLRLVLARKVIIVEGPSDELIVQRAYLDQYGRLPIEDGIDVLSVRGLSAKRFLDLAVPLGKRVAVITDNDGDEIKARARFADYTSHPFVTVHVGENVGGKTLEPQLLKANGRQVLNDVLGKSYDTDQKLLDYMLSNKTTSALAIFESSKTIVMPEFISEAIRI